MLALVPVIVFLGGLSVGAYDDTAVVSQADTIQTVEVALLDSHE